MNYTALSPISPEDAHQHNRFDEDAVSILSNAAPHAGYQAYRPPPENNHSPLSSPSNQQPSLSSTRTSRLLPLTVQNRVSWPAILPSRTSSWPQARSPTPSMGFQSHLSAHDRSYEHVLPWAESTYFRSPSQGSRSEIRNHADQRESYSKKQYYRSPRHLRPTWKQGGMRRFPWKGMGSLGVICLSTGSCIALLFAANHTTPGFWPANIQPSVYLSIIEVLMCLMTLSALTDGFAISFWVQLLHGISIGDIHDAHYSSSFGPALRTLARLKYNSIGFSTIVATLSLTRGPLFQRSLVLKDGTYEFIAIFMTIGTMVSFATVIATLPLYHRYWKLGRNASLNPLEIARAFDAPLFNGIDGNVTAYDIALERGDLSVRYGAVEKNGAEKVLRVEDMGRVNVRMPREEEIFG